MAKQFLRQTPFGIFIIVSSVAIFLTAVSSRAVLNFAQSEIGLTLLSTFPISILFLEIFLKKLDRHFAKTIKAAKLTTVSRNYWTKPMGVDQPGASYKSLIKTLNQNFNTTFLLKDSRSFKRVGLWPAYGN